MLKVRHVHEDQEALLPSCSKPLLAVPAWANPPTISVRNISLNVAALCFNMPGIDLSLHHIRGDTFCRHGYLNGLACD